MFWARHLIGSRETPTAYCLPSQVGAWVPGTLNLLNLTKFPGKVQGPTKGSTKPKAPHCRSK